MLKSYAIPKYDLQRPRPFFRRYYEVVDKDCGVNGATYVYSYPMGDGTWLFTTEDLFRPDKLDQKRHIKVDLLDYFTQHVVEGEENDGSAILRMADPTNRKYPYIYKAVYVSEHRAASVAMHEFIASFVGISPLLYDMWWTPPQKVDHTEMTKGGIRARPGFGVLHLLMKFIPGGAILNAKEHARIPFELRRVMMAELHMRSKYACIIHKDYALRNIVFDRRENRLLFIDWEWANLVSRRKGEMGPSSWRDDYDTVVHFSYQGEVETLKSYPPDIDSNGRPFLEAFEKMWLRRQKEDRDVEVEFDQSVIRFGALDLGDEHKVQHHHHQNTKKHQKVYPWDPVYVPRESDNQEPTGYRYDKPKERNPVYIEKDEEEPSSDGLRFDSDNPLKPVFVHNDTDE